jgi:two-component sensor histidine kinase/HAMP domain-containing protein
MFTSSQLLYMEMKRVAGNQQFSTVIYIASAVNGEIEIRVKSLENIAGQISPLMMADTANLQAYLEQRLNLQLLFNGGSFVVMTDGTAIADIPVSAGRRGVNYMDRDFIKGVLSDGKSTIGRPVIGKKLKSPIFVIAVPIRDIKGRVIGALTGVTNLGLTNFLDKISQTRYGNTGDFFLTSVKYRQVVTSSDRSRIMETLPAPGINFMVDQFINGYEGSIVSVNPLGVEVLSSSKRVPSAEWGVTVSLPTAEAFAPINSMLKRMLLVAFFLALLTSVIIWWILRYLLSPMHDALKTITEHTASNMPIKLLPVVRQDEIGDLFGSFNRLMTRVENQSLDLNIKNDQLETEIRYRKLNEEKIRVLLNEKEIILREVNHRIKNNMNTIHGILTLQSYTMKDTASISALEDSASRVKSMMVLYDKLYHSPDVQNISAADYFPGLIDEIIECFPNAGIVKMEKNIDDFILDAKRLQPLGIIINELLTNIMKYAFTGRDGGSIVVSAFLKGTVVSIEIQDNGNGLPESVNFENSTGFGLQLIGMLVKELHGTIRIVRGNGTGIILEFEI